MAGVLRKSPPTHGPSPNPCDLGGESELRSRRTTSSRGGTSTRWELGHNLTLMLMMTSGRIELRLNVLLLLLVLLAVMLLGLLASWLVLRGDVSTLGLLMILLAGLLSTLLTLIMMVSLGIELSYDRRDPSLTLLPLLSLLLPLALALLLLLGLVSQLDVITMTLWDTLTTRATKSITSLTILNSPTIDVLSDVGLLQVLGRGTCEDAIIVTVAEVLIDKSWLQHWGWRSCHWDGGIGISGVGDVPSSGIAAAAAAAKR